MKDKPISRKREGFVSLPVGMEKKKAEKGFCSKVKKIFKKSDDPGKRMFHVKPSETQAE
jgi:hypothetical protein|tara:strand:+ start:865 stop:1041 length:177 start_codon:yes stop_codon:yes gene_type:complete